MSLLEGSHQFGVPQDRGPRGPRESVATLPGAASFLIRDGMQSPRMLLTRQEGFLSTSSTSPRLKALGLRYSLLLLKATFLSELFLLHLAPFRDRVCKLYGRI